MRLHTQDVQWYDNQQQLTKSSHGQRVRTADVAQGALNAMH